MEYKRVTANGIDFAYLEQGEGPLALLLHGFPEAPTMYRHLMPVLAAAGYRTVAPAMRGFAPSQVPPDGMRVANLIADASALHEALGGDDNAVIIGHDWGGFATWGAAAHAPERWSRVVVADVPPVRFYAHKAADPAQIHKNSHFYFFQMGAADQILPVNDFAYLDWLWQHWTGKIPGFDSTPDRQAGKDALRQPANLRSGLGLYRDNFQPDTFGTDKWEMGRVLADLPTQPTLYLHGGEDPVVDEEILREIIDVLPEGSDGVLLKDVGHFPFLEAPDQVNELILKFLTK